MIKLNTKATDVDKVLAAIAGRPSVLNINRTPKSSAVLAAPMAANVSGLRLFGVAIMIFFDQIEWAMFGFFKNPANILTNYAQA